MNENNFQSDIQGTDVEQKKGKGSRNSLAKTIILAGTALAILSCFLPYFGVDASAGGFASDAASFNYVKDGKDGVFVIACMVVTLLLALKFVRCSIIPSAVALFIWIYDASQIKDTVGSALSGDGMLSAGLQYGAYLVLIGIIIAMAGAVVAMILRNKE